MVSAETFCRHQATPRAYLLRGPPGAGKTFLAQEFAKSAAGDPGAGGNAWMIGGMACFLLDLGLLKISSEEI